ncbi:MAG: hypothetical protein HQL31_14150, partial [Planctomycetes bacterium]|nr:hypothetical protein [Planctomycetota bacterium]
MSLLVAYLFAAAAILALHVWFMSRRHAGLRVVHFIVLLLLLALLWPVILNWEKTSFVSAGKRNRGLILVDRSASMLADEEAGRRLLAQEEKIKDLPETNLVWAGFSEGLLPPLGQAGKGKGTLLFKSLGELVPELEELEVDWIWLWTDGGFETGALSAQALTGVRKYVSDFSGEEDRNDMG